MSDEQLHHIQEQMYHQFGHKVDLHHSEAHRGILVVPYGAPLHPANILARIQY